MKKLVKNYIDIFRYSVIAIFLTQSSYAQQDNEDQPYLDQSFLIISSSTNYDEAQTIALEARDKLELDYPTSSYYPNKKEGFKTDEICGCGEVHNYFPRGRYDDGDYISIEYSSAYEGFTEGYYMVIVSSGQKESVQKELPKVQEKYDQAYIKNSEIYVGCMH